MEVDLLLFLATFFLSLLFVVFASKQWHTSKKLPPGPWKLPFIGNLHHLVGSRPHHSLKKLSDKYGPIMHLQVGELETIVVSSVRLAEQVLKTNGHYFLDRPELAITEIMFYNFSGLGALNHGEHWKQMRKLFVMELLSPKKVQSFHYIIEEEVSNLVSFIRSSPRGEAINLTEKLYENQSAIICRAAVGRKCSDQKALITLAEETVAFAGIFNFGDVFPSLKFLDFFFGSKRTLLNIRKKVDVVLENIFREHQEDRLIARKGEESAVDEDILDVLLRVKDSKQYSQNNISITDDTVKANIFELLMAGTEASSVAIEWTMTEMMRHPIVLEKAQREVRNAFKGKGSLILEDGANIIQNLSYLKMVIKESMRLNPSVPLLCPRMCKEKCTIDGYDIPPNTVTLVNCWAVQRDPECWNNPLVFEPERFSNISTGYAGAHSELIPFSAGRRMCPGMAFATATIEFALAYLLYHFDWKLPDGINAEELDMSEKTGALSKRKYSLCLIPTTYIPHDESSCT